MQESDNPLWLKRAASESNRLPVTNRRYEEVAEALVMNEKYFTPQIKILSIGEGLSNFANTLRERGANVLAVDPIYSDIPTSLNFSHQELKKEINNKYNGKVDIYNIPDQTHLPQPGQAIAASVYQLPFTPELFDMVTSNRMFEHIDLAKAVPEMIRIIKMGGEVRMGGVLLDTALDQRKLLTGHYESIMRGMGFVLEEATGFTQAIDWVKQNNIKVYIVITSESLMLRAWGDDPDQKDEVSDSYRAGVLIFRKDNKKPIISTAYKDYKKGKIKYPHIGEIYQVIPKIRNNEGGNESRYFELKPIKLNRNSKIKTDRYLSEPAL